MNCDVPVAVHLVGILNSLLITDVKRPSEFSERFANLVTETFAEPAVNW